MDIWAYFDESGTHKGSRALAVGGFLARSDAWGAFIFEWENLLQAFQIEYFHMATFENRRGVYADWKDERRRDFMQQALRIINRHVLGSAGTVIPLADYDAVFPEDEIPEGPNVQMLAPGIFGPGAERPGDLPPTEVSFRPGELRRKTGGAYGLAAHATALSISRLVKSFSGDPFVAYVFEQGAKGFGQIAKVFQGILDDENSRRDLRVLSVAFQDKGQAPPLQAADLLAYELHKHLPRQLGIEERPVRYTLRELAKMPRTWGWLDADELRKWHYVLGRGLHYSVGIWNK